MTSAVLNYLSFKCSHARSLSGVHGGVLWGIFDDLCFSEISQPCFDPVAVAGVCITSKYFFFFVKFKRGNLSDGWRLDWCVCRKSVNNINFIWINKKVGSGKSHMAFFFSQVILSSTDKLFSNQSFELMTQSHLTVRAALCLIFLHEMRSVKDVPSNLSFWRFWETLFRLRAELWNAGSRAGLPTP